MFKTQRCQITSDSTASRSRMEQALRLSPPLMRTIIVNTTVCDTILRCKRTGGSKIGVELLIVHSGPTCAEYVLYGILSLICLSPLSNMYFNSSAYLCIIAVGPPPYLKA